MVTLTGCTTTEKFYVYGPDGTTIYTPYNRVTPQGSMSRSNKIEIEVPSDIYCGYILVQPTDYDIKIPIGIDYKICRHTGTKAALYTGGALTSVGSGAAMIGSIAMLAAACGGDGDDSDSFGMVAGVGGAIACIGAGIGFTSQNRLRQTAYDYNFGYEKQQRIEIPQLSFTLLNPNKPKGYIEQVQTVTKSSSSRSKASSGKDIKNGYGSNSPTKGSKVNKNRIKNSRNIEGIYKGTGSLLEGTKINENYPDIEISIKKIDQNHVSVNIIENGEEYFDAPLVYKIIINKNKEYDLYIDKMPEAKIHIYKNGKLRFNHKKVNIDNKIYTLDIKATKQ